MDDSLKAAAAGAVVGGAVPLVARGLSNGYKWFTEKLPERIRTPIYRDSERDALAYLQSQAKGGKVNPTLARESLEEGV